MDPDTIAKALDIMAQLIARDGPKFMPIYERLEAEYEAATKRNDALSRALARAKAA